MSKNQLKEFAQWLDPLTWKLEPKQRRTLMAIVAQEVRRANQQSMRAQKAPDGTPWQERRRRIISRHGVRAGAERARQRQGPMMVKLRKTSNMWTRATPEEAEMGFVGKVMQVARVHHYGLPDKVSDGGPEHVYAERPLIGISEETIGRLRARILSWLSGQ